MKIVREIMKNKMLTFRTNNKFKINIIKNPQMHNIIESKKLFR